jgi:hypothetical protein
MLYSSDSEDVTTEDSEGNEEADEGDEEEVAFASDLGMLHVLTGTQERELCSYTVLARVQSRALRERLGWKEEGLMSVVSGGLREWEIVLSG